MWGIGTLERYIATDQIGEGTYGQVFKAVDRVTGDTVALKKLTRHHETEGFPKTETREIKILAGMRHVNLVLLREIVSSISVAGLAAAAAAAARDASRAPDVGAGGGAPPASSVVAAKATGAPGGALGGAPAAEAAPVEVSFEKLGDIFMVFEYVDYDLAGLLESGYHFDSKQVRVLIAQLLRVLDALHSASTVHRDLKTSNVLLRDDFTLKLADFGLSRTLGDASGEPGARQQEATNKVITLWYRPPELLLGATAYGGAVDMWSLGCILIELLSGRTPFPAKAEAEAARAIFSVLGTPSEDSPLRSLPLWGAFEMADPTARVARLDTWLSTRHPAVAADPAAASLVSRLLELDPRKRATAREALAHRYFDGISHDAPTKALDGAYARVSTNPNKTFKAGVDHHEYAAKQRHRAAERRERGEPEIPPPTLLPQSVAPAAVQAPPPPPSVLPVGMTAAHVEALENLAAALIPLRAEAASLTSALRSNHFEPRNWAARARAWLLAASEVASDVRAVCIDGYAAATAQSSLDLAIRDSHEQISVELVSIERALIAPPAPLPLPPPPAPPQPYHHGSSSALLPRRDDDHYARRRSRSRERLDSSASYAPRARIDSAGKRDWDYDRDRDYRR
jgi:serine/threonine protein kinase